MQVSVVIPVFNEEKYLEKCLASIAAQTEKPDELIIVDNNCSDKTVEIAKKFGARIVKEKTQGMIFARNAGFNAAKYEILAKTDADAILPRDWILKIKKNFADPDLGGLSGPASYFKTSLMSDISIAIAYNTFTTIGHLLGHPMLLGPNMALRKSLWEKIRKDVCLSGADVHEDIDLSIHLAVIAKIKFDRHFIVKTTRSRWKDYLTEYIARLMKMLKAHKELIEQAKRSNQTIPFS
jgi:glycosyltransferase involved in cell wall biosynthesis